MTTIRLERHQHLVTGITAFALAAAVLYYALYQLPYFGDFDSVYYPVLSLANPYERVGFLNPPWALFALYPLRLLPAHAAGAAWMLFSILSVVYCARRLGADWLAYLLIFTNPAFIRFLTSGQLGALVLWGLVVTHPSLSVLLLTIKPQVLGAAVLLRLRRFNPDHVALVAAVVIGALLAFGNWPAALLHNWQHGLNQSVSMDIFPYGVPFGLAFLYVAYRRDDSVLAGLSTFFFAPYVSPGSMFIYSVLIFSTFAVVPRLVVYGLLWTVALVLT